MSEMIERVAEAIMGAVFNKAMDADPRSRMMARAAIEAMHEPTEAMAIAGKENNFGYYPNEAWRAMIDAALTPPSSTPTIPE